jgi:flotillin
MNLVTPIAVIAIVIAFVALGAIVATRYKRVPPNAIGVFYGRKYSVVVDGPSGPQKITRGFRIVTGGGSILWPVVERYQEMSTAVFQVDVAESAIPTKKNVPVNVVGTATCRISPNLDEQSNAVQAFLGKEQREIDETIKAILRGHVRTIIGKLEVEELLRDRTQFNKMVLEESAQEFRQIGVLVSLVLNDVRDSHGYIEALGRQEIAAKLRDAEIETARAKRDATVKVSEADREAAAAKADNAALIAEAEKNQKVKEATFKAETERQRALAEVAFEIAKAEQDKQLAVAQAQRDAESAMANTAVEEKKAVLREKELNATTIVEAEAERKAIVIRAEGKRQAAVVEAEALQQVAERRAKQVEVEAEGKRAAAIKEGEGESKKTTLLADAKASATRATMTAEAEGRKATLLAEAEGTQRKLLAEADGKKAELLAVADGKKAGLLAEAEGTHQLAEALKQLSEQGKLILILDRLPGLMEKGGDAGAKIFESIFRPLGESMGSISNVSIVDMGGNGKGLESFGSTLPKMVANFFASAKAAGVDVTPLLSMLKVDPSKLQAMLGQSES